MFPEEIEGIAKVCHQANKAFCEFHNDHSKKDWNNAEPWQKESAIKGVQFRLDNPESPASAQHDAWSADKIKDGWKYGDIKDPEAKTHPCLVSFEDLPVSQRSKDTLFCAIVDALKS